MTEMIRAIRDWGMSFFKPEFYSPTEISLDEFRGNEEQYVRQSMKRGHVVVRDDSGQMIMAFGQSRRDPFPDDDELEEEIEASTTVREDCPSHRSWVH